MTAIVRTEVELREQRARLIARAEAAGMTEATLFERGARWDLYPEHRSIYETVRDIDWLLGEDQPHTD